MPLTMTFDTRELADLKATLATRVRHLDDRIEGLRIDRSRLMIHDINAAGIATMEVIEELDRAEKEWQRITTLLRRIEVGI